MNDYPEITRLSSLRDQFNISVQATEEVLCNKSWFRKVNFNIGSHSFSIFVDDEYDDLKIDNPNLHLCLVLRSLENYRDAEDFLVWCTQLGLNASDDATREHHMELRTIYASIQKILGNIDSFISDLDFQLNSGAAQKLRGKD